MVALKKPTVAVSAQDPLQKYFTKFRTSSTTNVAHQFPSSATGTGDTEVVSDEELRLRRYKKDPSCTKEFLCKCIRRYVFTGV